MAPEPFHVDSYQQMVIHLNPDGSECRVRKPDTVCPCGAYRVRWMPVRELVKHWTMQEWMRGEDVSHEPS
jgi:hypothetical protein